MSHFVSQSKDHRGHASSTGTLPETPRNCVLPSFDTLIRSFQPDTATPRSVGYRVGKPATKSGSARALATTHTNTVPEFKQLTSVFVSNPNFQKEFRKHKCTQCDKRFKTIGHLSRHMFVHKNQFSIIRERMPLQARSVPNQIPQRKTKPVFKNYTFVAKKSYPCHFKDCKCVYSKHENYLKHLNTHSA